MHTIGSFDAVEGVLGVVALGGVAHKPWRAHLVEAALKGKPATPEGFHAAAEVEFAHARLLRHNEFKIELARRTCWPC